MSRTKHSSKPPGFEYGGTRPNFGCVPDIKDKQLTHQIERSRGKQSLLKEPHEPEYDPQEDTSDICDDCYNGVVEEQKELTALRAQVERYREALHDISYSFKMSEEDRIELARNALRQGEDLCPKT